MYFSNTLTVINFLEYSTELAYLKLLEYPKNVFKFLDYPNCI